MSEWLYGLWLQGADGQPKDPTRDTLIWGWAGYIPGIVIPIIGGRPRAGVEALDPYPGSRMIDRSTVRDF